MENTFKIVQIGRLLSFNSIYSNEYVALGATI